MPLIIFSEILQIKYKWRLEGLPWIYRDSKYHSPLNQVWLNHTVQTLKLADFLITIFNTRHGNKQVKWWAECNWFHQHTLDLLLRTDVLNLWLLEYPPLTAYRSTIFGCRVLTGGSSHQVNSWYRNTKGFHPMLPPGTALQHCPTPELPVGYSETSVAALSWFNFSLPLPFSHDCISQEFFRINFLQATLGLSLFPGKPI